MYAKFNLKVCYPTPYECEVWKYKDVNNNVIW